MRRIRWKIIFPYAFLVLVLAVAGTYLTTRLVAASVGERFDNQLVEAGRVTGDGVVRKERDHLETVRAVAFTQGLSESVRLHDAGRIDDLIQGIAVNAEVERLEVLDIEGRRLRTLLLSDPENLVYEELRDADNPAQWSLVQRVLRSEVDSSGDKHAQLVETRQGFVLYTAGPILKDGQRVGAVLVGTSLESLARQLKAEALADITIYDFRGQPLASTFARPEDASSTEANLDVGGATLQAVRSGVGSLREHRTLWGRGYDLLYGRLLVRDRVVGFFSVALPTDFLFDAGRDTRWQMAVLFGLGMAAALGIGLYLAHVMTKPILRLVHAARLVAAGDLTVRSGVKSDDEIGVLASSFDEMTSKLQRQHLATVRALTSAIDARDPYTMGHSVRVGQMAVMIGQHLRLDHRTLTRLEIGGYLHDIGKIGIRDAILLKPAALTLKERLAIHEHPRIGLAILESVDLPQEVIQFVQGHHERLDGSGYPNGLQDEQVSIVARIAAVADMYDALTTERPYRGPMQPEEALTILWAEAGRALDTKVVEALGVILGEWERRRASEPELRGFKLPELDTQEVTLWG